MKMTLKTLPDQDCPKPGAHGLYRTAAPLLLFALSLTGCKHEAASQSAEAPPAAQVEEIGGSNLVHVDGAGRFSLVQAFTQPVRTKLQVTGSVNPDVSREIPVLSLANGRVVALHVGLGDYVHKGQLVMEVQSPDVSTAFDAYLKAVNDEHLATVTLDRDNLLYNKGAIPKSQQEAAQTGEDDAKADLIAAEQQLKILGVDKNHPSENVRIYAPTSGVITAQNVTAAGAAGITYAGAAGSLTIADLSHVWVICDVYENDLANVRVGQHADITLNAFPGKTFSGTISDIGAQLDPSLRTAKVRIQVENPQHLLRIGMFATAILQGSRAEQRTVVPATAILQLHDRSYVFQPASDGTFKRVLVTIGDSLPGNLLVVTAGVQPGQQVVNNALDLENAAEQQ
ncbi:efflux RND transporter periplasmic adaptor subunit [Granulicella sp. L46]|uniref:efflux RND transporter periplasmic adaptor subunit n=1 Tax=Granulicella sp. L46 TaxID=1641865 RepID=UPI0020B169FE|nr:efflux RND transporter periplasmic adaptor subunit [Granulicella sp. L46]